MHWIFQTDQIQKLAETVNENAPVHNWGELEKVIEKGLDWCVQTGTNIIGAIIIYLVGRLVIFLVKKIMERIAKKDKLDKSVQSFVKSLVNITLNILLFIAIISKLGIETTSFAALLASAGVAIGMALSGNLSNFAGGLMVLIFRPYKIGDYIECPGGQGYVKEIQIFHTILTTYDKKTLYIPNGQTSSGCVINHFSEEKRRLEWSISVEYGQDFEKVKEVLLDLCKEDERILKDPAPFVALGSLAESSVKITLWIWVESANYWGVHFDMNRNIYERFNASGISFPYPHLSIDHKPAEPKA